MSSRGASRLPSCDEGVDRYRSTSPRAVSKNGARVSRRFGPCGSWSVFLLSSFQEASPDARFQERPGRGTLTGLGGVRRGLVSAGGRSF